ncbi:hypothetical protein Nepgr_033506 [Nepenthes gracilis]|uniref:Uncharacterized protein n=1 Tax=Nepenthes gracilis TaxID=150966 RepID=A0AAD3Y6N0_NEPGR|nr:hypothetical protein Nepgr_033506 [Nepenthes gracilis]
MAYSVDMQESKLKNLSPLAREVAARIKALLRADDQSEHQDEALPGLASPQVDILSPRMQDSSLKVHNSIIKKPFFRQLCHYNPLLINEKEIENWVFRKTRASHKGQW